MEGDKFCMAVVEDAIILSAGLGTRLRPLTDNVPKPLIKINNKEVLEHILERLEANDIKRAYINASYLADQIKAFKTKTKIKLIVQTETEIKGTGGGILSFAWALKDKLFFVLNGDSIFNFDLQSLNINFDKASDARILLLNKNGNVLSEKGYLKGFLNKGEKLGLLYTGVQLINGTKFFSNNFIKKNEKELNKFSCIIHDIYKSGNFKIQTLIVRDILWVDIGTIEGLTQAKKYLK